MKNRLSYLIGIILLTTWGYAMAISDVGKVCLFSAISGVITLDGKPVANARLVRIVKKEGAKTDETTTDEKGYFQFPPVFDRTITKFLPMEFVVSQVIDLHHQGMKYELWNGVKRNPDENTESRGLPLIVQCELNQERMFKEVNGSPIISLCKWEAKADPKVDWSKKSAFDSDVKK